jgi:hypothetical protein
MDWLHFGPIFSKARLVTVSPTNIGFQRFEQGCQMVSFQTKNTNLGIFWKTLEWKKFLHIYSGHWNIL